eukprot:7905959-Alexandrium_andersonii.AAC.1
MEVSARPASCVYCPATPPRVAPMERSSNARAAYISTAYHTANDEGPPPRPLRAWFAAGQAS